MQTVCGAAPCQLNVLVPGVSVAVMLVQLAAVEPTMAPFSVKVAAPVIVITFTPVPAPAKALKARSPLTAIAPVLRVMAARRLVLVAVFPAKERLLVTVREPAPTASVLILFPLGRLTLTVVACSDEVAAPN